MFIWKKVFILLFSVKAKCKLCYNIMRLQPNQIWTSIEIYSNWFFFVICFHFRFHSVIFCIGYLKFSLDSWWKLENFRKFSRLLKFHESFWIFKLNFKRKSYLKYLRDFLHCEKKVPPFVLSKNGESFIWE